MTTVLGGKELEYIKVEDLVQLFQGGHGGHACDVEDDILVRIAILSFCRGLRVGSDPCCFWSVCRCCQHSANIHGAIAEIEKPA